jgi:carboxypeptidase Taq
MPPIPATPAKASSASVVPESPAYARLVAAWRRLHRLHGALGLLHWDEEVNLPPLSAGARAEELAVLAEIAHRELTRPEIGAWLAEIEAGPGALSAEQTCVVRWARRAYDRATRLPPAFVARRAEARSRAYHAWTAARADRDFAAFAPHLQTQLDLARAEAEYQGFSGRPYDYCLDEHDPGMTAMEVERLFAPLRMQLPPLAARILAGAARWPAPELRGFPVAGQEALAREIVAWLGFDFQRGRLDRSVHPFCGGHPEDLRMTTRFDEDRPLDALFSSMHETGHALYEQALPRAHLGTALAEAVGMAVHESQSRLWENQIGRSRAFWRRWEPRLRAVFPTQSAAWSSEDLYLAINAVSRQPIRVDADEVTYNLHVLLRFELEQAFFRGDLAVADAPAAWNELAQKFLGLTPRDAAEGILQDVHWSHGSFGYFPSYTLGNMFAAQLWEALRAEIPAAESLDGGTAPIRAWLHEKIHRWGRQFDTLELCRRATGKPLSSEALLRYLAERYGAIYGG